MVRPASAETTAEESARRGSSDDALAAEARILGLYLIGREPPVALATRYAAAARTVGNPKPSAVDCRILKLALDWPFFLGPLDAACALLRPRSMLREKLIRLAAVLEASPDFADDFLPQSPGVVFTLVRLGWIGTACVAEFFVGAVLLKAVELNYRVAGPSS